MAARSPIVLTLEYDRTKPYHSAAGHPWHMSEAQALEYVFDPSVAPADAAYESLVPPRACVGAVLSSSEPSYLLWGRNGARRVFYLTSSGALPEALARGVSCTSSSQSGRQRACCRSIQEGGLEHRAAGGLLAARDCAASGLDRLQLAGIST